MSRSGGGQVDLRNAYQQPSGYKALGPPLPAGGDIDSIRPATSRVDMPASRNYADVTRPVRPSSATSRLLATYGGTPSPTADTVITKQDLRRKRGEEYLSERVRQIYNDVGRDTKPSKKASPAFQTSRAYKPDAENLYDTIHALKYQMQQETDKKAKMAARCRRLEQVIAMKDKKLEEALAMHSQHTSYNTYQREMASRERAYNHMLNKLREKIDQQTTTIAAYEDTVNDLKANTKHTRVMEMEEALTQIAMELQLAHERLEKQTRELAQCHKQLEDRSETTSQKAVKRLRTMALGLNEDKKRLEKENRVLKAYIVEKDKELALAQVATASLKSHTKPKPVSPIKRPLTQSYEVSLTPAASIPKPPVVQKPSRPSSASRNRLTTPGRTTSLSTPKRQNSQKPTPTEPTAQVETSPSRSTEPTSSKETEEQCTRQSTTVMGQAPQLDPIQPSAEGALQMASASRDEKTLGSVELVAEASSSSNNELDTTKDIQPIDSSVDSWAVDAVDEDANDETSTEIERILEGHKTSIDPILSPDLNDDDDDDAEFNTLMSFGTATGATSPREEKEETTYEQELDQEKDDVEKLENNHALDVDAVDGDARSEQTDEVDVDKDDAEGDGADEAGGKEDNADKTNATVDDADEDDADGDHADEEQADEDEAEEEDADEVPADLNEVSAACKIQKMFLTHSHRQDSMKFHRDTTKKHRESLTNDNIAPMQQELLASIYNVANLEADNEMDEYSDMDESSEGQMTPSPSEPALEDESNDNATEDNPEIHGDKQDNAAKTIQKAYRRSSMTMSMPTDIPTQYNDGDDDETYSEPQGSEGEASRSASNASISATDEQQEETEVDNHDAEASLRSEYEDMKREMPQMERSESSSSKKSQEAYEDDTYTQVEGDENGNTSEPMTRTDDVREIQNKAASAIQNAYRRSSRDRNLIDDRTQQYDDEAVYSDHGGSEGALMPSSSDTVLEQTNSAGGAHDEVTSPNGEPDEFNGEKTQGSQAPSHEPDHQGSVDDAKGDEGIPQQSEQLVDAEIDHTVTSPIGITVEQSTRSTVVDSSIEKDLNERTDVVASDLNVESAAEIDAASEPLVTKSSQNDLVPMKEEPGQNDIKMDAVGEDDAIEGFPIAKENTVDEPSAKYEQITSIPVKETSDGGHGDENEYLYDITTPRENAFNEPFQSEPNQSTKTEESKFQSNEPPNTNDTYDEHEFDDEVETADQQLIHSVTNHLDDSEDERSEGNGPTEYEDEFADEDGTTTEEINDISHDAHLLSK